MMVSSPEPPTSVTPPWVKPLASRLRPRGAGFQVSAAVPRPPVKFVAEIDRPPAPPRPDPIASSKVIVQFPAVPVTLTLSSPTVDSPARAVWICAAVAL
jgi:hypothetical protein